MLELKYHRGLYVLRDIEVLVREASHVLEWLEGAVLVPVPMHPRKRRERGYNQTELIAKVIARACLGGVRIERLLRRVQDGLSQTTFDRKARLENLRHAFEVHPSAKIDAKFRYVLLDDVFTTGSTLNRCAAALRKAGAGRIDVLTYGHG
jgi:ComF family protein